MEKCIKVRCEESQLEKWKQDAKSWGMNLSEYLRTLASRQGSGMFEEAPTPDLLGDSVRQLRTECSALRRMAKDAAPVVKEKLEREILLKEIAIGTIYAYGKIKKGKM